MFSTVLRIRIRVRGMIRIRIWVRGTIRILLLSSKNNKKNLDSYWFVTYLWIHTVPTCNGSATLLQTKCQYQRKGKGFLPLHLHPGQHRAAPHEWWTYSATWTEMYVFKGKTKTEKKLLKLVSWGIFSDKGRYVFATFINIQGKQSVNLLMY